VVREDHVFAGLPLCLAGDLGVDHDAADPMGHDKPRDLGIIGDEQGGEHGGAGA
jgi:hypothetical protein